MSFFSRCSKTLWCCVSIALIYGLQFLVLPPLLSRFYPQSNEATAVLFLPLLAMAVIGVMCFDVPITAWLASDGVYCVLLLAYHGRGLYGIGLRGVMLDGMHPVYSFPLALCMIFALLGGMLTVQGVLRGVRRWTAGRKSK